MKWVLIEGPNTSGPFGRDSYLVESDSDVKVMRSGSVIITTAAEPDSPHAGRRKPRRVHYPAGQCWKVTTGDIEESHE